MFNVDSIYSRMPARIKKIPFEAYLSTLCSRFGTCSFSAPLEPVFSALYALIWGLRAEYLTRGVSRYLGLALLSGARYSQITACACELAGSVLSLSLPGLKGGRSTSNVYTLQPGAFAWASEALPRGIEVPSDDALAFSLKRMSPSLYDHPYPGHHSLSHMPRYFVVNLLRGPLGFDSFRVSDFLGLEDPKTLSYYEDMKFLRDLV